MTTIQAAPLFAGELRTLSPDEYRLLRQVRMASKASSKDTSTHRYDWKSVVVLNQSDLENPFAVATDGHRLSCTHIDRLLHESTVWDDNVICRVPKVWLPSQTHSPWMIGWAEYLASCMRVLPDKSVATTTAQLYPLNKAAWKVDARAMFPWLLTAQGTEISMQALRVGIPEPDLSSDKVKLSCGVFDRTLMAKAVAALTSAVDARSLKRVWLWSDPDTNGHAAVVLTARDTLAGHAEIVMPLYPNKK